MTTNLFYEFFAGVGLARLGLAPEWEPLWANDIDPKKAETYFDNFGKDHFFLGDISTVKPDDLPGWAHMSWASFPCQDLSLAGWRRGMNGHRSGTFWSFWKLMRDLNERRPPLIVLENVVGLLHGPDFTGLVEALVDLDMRVGALVIDAVKFVPQSRPRIFVVAVSRKLSISEFETDSPEESSWLPKSIRNAYHQLPSHLQTEWVWWKLPEPAEPEVRIFDIVESEPTGVQWHSQDETQRLLDLMNPLHRDRVRQAQASGKLEIGFIYKRTRQGKQQAEIRFDGIAGCLRTPTGGSSRQTIMIVQGSSVRSRLISPREMAGFMGAPEFILPEKYNQAYYAMGDAVVAPAVHWLSEHLLTPLVVQYDQKVGHFGWSLLRAGG